VWRGAGRDAARVVRRVTECDGPGCTSWPGGPMGRVCVRILLAGVLRVHSSYPSGTGDSTSEIFIELLFMTGR